MLSRDRFFEAARTPSPSPTFSTSPGAIDINEGPGEGTECQASVLFSSLRFSKLMLHFFDKATTHVLPFSISIRVFQRTDICLGDRYNDNARTVRTIIFTKTPDVEEFGLGTEKGVGRLARPRLFDIRDFQAVYVVDMLGLVLGTSYSQRLVSIQEQIIDL